jgi:hypothetical protein
MTHLRRQGAIVKNVQVIDGALNCTYPIHACSDRAFAELFPGGADVEFVEDFTARVGAVRARALLKTLWGKPVDKKTATGIQGTLFHGLRDRRPFYPTRREAETLTGAALLAVLPRRNRRR